MVVKNLGWGLVGTGWVSRTFADDLHTHGHAIAAVGSRTVEAATVFAEEYGCRAYEGVDAMVADPAVDIVYVGVPNHRHFDVTLAAIGAGKHVLVEKPFALDAAEARAMIAAARAAGVVIMEAMWVRFLPHAQVVRSWVTDGRIGEPRMLLADHTRRLSDDATARWNVREMGGGALLDLGVYPLSLAVELFGAPVEVQATGVLTDAGVDARASIALRHANGALTTIATSMSSQGANRAAVLGSRGRIEWSPGWDPARVVLTNASGVEIDVSEPSITGRGMQFQAAEMERLVRAGVHESPLMTHEDTLAVMTLLDEVRSRLGVVFT